MVTEKQVEMSDMEDAGADAYHMDRCQATDLELAADECRRAVEFMDRVRASSDAEKNAVGNDHWDWLERAARKVAEAAPSIT